MVIVKALYRLHTSGARYHEGFADKSNVLMNQIYGIEMLKPTTNLYVYMSMTLWLSCYSPQLSLIVWKNPNIILEVVSSVTQTVP